MKSKPSNRDYPLKGESSVRKLDIVPDSTLLAGEESKGDASDFFAGNSKKVPQPARRLFHEIF
ncbi:MAG: hypothetical protein DRH10_09250 [Deltaproteobacteria bacterium]|nr:MAG: hypothetical protein DRH10_09250 [Deltaproteobacteria bacterium]